jgi:hypothetical protein
MLSLRSLKMSALRAMRHYSKKKPHSARVYIENKATGRTKILMSSKNYSPFFVPQASKKMDENSLSF